MDGRASVIRWGVRRLYGSLIACRSDDFDDLVDRYGRESPGIEAHMNTVCVADARGTVGVAVE